MDAASPWFPGTALRDPAGPSHSPGFTVHLPFKSSGGSKASPGTRKKARSPASLIGIPLASVRPLKPWAREGTPSWGGGDLALLTPPSTSRGPWEAGGHTCRPERPSRVPLPRHKASIAQRMTRTQAPSREGRQPAALCARIIFLSPFLSQRLAGCQQSRFAEPGQIRPGTKLGCCKASKRPRTAGHPEPPPPPPGSASMPHLHVGCKWTRPPGWGQGDKAGRNWAGSRRPQSTQETRGQDTLPERC